MSQQLANGKQQFIDGNGNPLAGGTVAFYLPGTLTPTNTWADEGLTVLNPNPVTLDANGMASIWGADGTLYRQVVTDANGNQIWDQVVGLIVGAAAVTAPDGEALSALLETYLARVVTSISALRNVSKAYYAQCFVTGYYASGDGGGGAYYYDASDTSSADNGGTVIVASDGGRWKLTHTGIVSVKQFGAKCDGATDDTAAINAALASLTSGGTLLVPGMCVISSALTVSYNGIRVVGIGRTSSGFVTSSATANMFEVASGLVGVEFHDFSLWASITKTAGRCFDCADASRFVFENLLLADRSLVATYGNRLYEGIYLAGCDDCNIINCQIAGYSSNAVTVYGSGGYSSELHIGGGTRISGAAYGVLCAGNFGGLYLDDVSIDSCVKDVVLNQSLSATINREIFVNSGAVLDACNDTCLEVQANGASYLCLNGAWLASAGKYGTASGNQTCLNVLPTNAALVLQATGARFFNANNTGVAINGCASAVLSGCQVDANTTDGVNIANSAVGPVSITGGRITGSGTGLVVASGVTALNARGVDLTGNTNSTSITPALSSSIVVAQCYGYTSENSGQVALSSASATTTVSHGLSGTPNTQDVGLTLATGPGSAAWFAITGVTSTTFTITASAAPGAGVVMNWRAKLPGA